MNREKFVIPLSGYLGVVVTILTLALGILLFVFFPNSVPAIVIGIILCLLTIFMVVGLLVVNPNESAVLVLFGKYSGTVVKNGFFLG